jgi:hypothetical protein
MTWSISFTSWWLTTSCLDPFDAPLARPHPDALATAELVVANPHDGLSSMGRSTYPGLLDHAPPPAGLGEHGLGAVVDSVSSLAGCRGCYP